MPEEKIGTIRQLFERLGDLGLKLVAGDPHLALRRAYPGRNFPQDILANNGSALAIVMTEQFLPKPCWFDASPEVYEEYISSLLKLRREKYGASNTETVTMFARELAEPGGFGHPVYSPEKGCIYAFVRARYRGESEEIEIKTLKMVGCKEEWEMYLTVPEIAKVLFTGQS